MRREQVYTNVKISCISRLKYSSDQRRDNVNVPLEKIITIMDDSENTSPKFWITTIETIFKEGHMYNPVSRPRVNKVW